MYNNVVFDFEVFQKKKAGLSFHTVNVDDGQVVFDFAIFDYIARHIPITSVCGKLK